ncbi:MAG: Zn-dependent hydrolase [Moheibacter sp.]
MRRQLAGIILILGILSATSCKNKENQDPNKTDKPEIVFTDDSLKTYSKVKLTTDLSQLNEREKAMLILFIKTAQIMDELFWHEAYGDKNELISKTPEELRNYVEINYGPWDRLDNNRPFLNGFGPKPLGANFYPANMTREEFENANLKNGKSLYTMVRRDEKGKLYTVFYHEYFKKQISKATELLRRAATYAENPELKKYLLLRAEALETDNYYDSDIAWMDMKTSRIDFVVGPIETYEDELFGYKASHSAYVLVKDLDWSKKLERFVNYLPELQKNLPVPDPYKVESPGTESDLNAYDVIYYAGDCNAGGKTIAINLPNDEKVQLKKGTRRLQLKNAMNAKFENIMMPITNILIDESQRQWVSFDAFFTNVMFHEIAHGLGIKNTINEKGTVREALKEQQLHLEEGKADILGLYMVLEMLDKKELQGRREEYMVTFLAGILRSIRFGGSAHGTANMICFNYFQENEAFSRSETGTYIVNFDKMEESIKGLSELILTLQGNGDYEGVVQLTKDKGIITPELQKDLDKLKSAKIPDDIIFEQGIKILGL